jgi:hypothetical protein
MHFSSSTYSVKALALTSIIGSAQAFWRMPCLAQSGVARIDPLVSPGTASEHVHTIHGSSGMLQAL